jgi:hypothetical protein
LVSRLSRAAAYSLVIGLVAGVLAHYADVDAIATGVMVGILSLPVAFLNARRRRSHEEARWPTPVSRQAEAIRGETPHPQIPTPDQPARRCWFRRQTDTPIADEGLEAAWAIAESLADWAPSRLARVRTSCAAFLREAEITSLDIEVKELTLLIRRRIPELIKACAEQCLNATHSERESLVEDLLESLESVGAEADRYRKEVRRAHGTPFDVLRAHVAARVRREGWL